jgi:ABC-2 type transport system permease protein
VIGALRLDLRRSRAVVAWIGLLSALYAGFITAFYPVVLDNAARFAELMDVYPKELMAAFGISGDLGDPGVFLNSYVFQFLWPLVAAIVAIVTATRVAADAERGFLELPLSTRLPRTRYLAATIAGQVLAMAALTFVTVASVWLVDLFIAPDFAIDRLALAGLHALCMGLAIAGVTSLLAVVLLDRGRAAGSAAGVLVLMYLVNVIAQLAPDLREAAVISAFHYFDLEALIDSGAYPLGDSLLFGVVAAGGWALALVAFRRRDLVV